MRHQRDLRREHAVEEGRLVLPLRRTSGKAPRRWEQTSFGFMFSAPPPPPVVLPVVKACPGAEPGLCLNLACRWNTTLDITDNGSIKLATPRSGERTSIILRNGRYIDRDTHRPLTAAEVEAFDDAVVERLATLESNCAIDFALQGGMTLDEVAEQLGLTKERVRQIEDGAQDKMREGMAGFREED